MCGFAIWWDWMVVCAVNCEPVSLLFGRYQGDFQKNSEPAVQTLQKALQRRHLSEFSANPIIEKNRERPSGNTERLPQ